MKPKVGNIRRAVRLRYSTENKTPPMPGWILLGDAIAEIGFKAHPDTWTGEEWCHEGTIEEEHISMLRIAAEALASGLHTKVQIPDPMDMTAIATAMARFADAVNTLRAPLIRGELQALAAGRPVEPSFWLTSQAWFAFREESYESHTIWLEAAAVEQLPVAMGPTVPEYAWASNVSLWPADEPSGVGAVRSGMGTAAPVVDGPGEALTSDAKEVPAVDDHPLPEPATGLVIGAAEEAEIRGGRSSPSPSLHPDWISKASELARQQIAEKNLENSPPKWAEWIAAEVDAAFDLKKPKSSRRYLLDKNIYWRWCPFRRAEVEKSGARTAAH